MKKLIAILSLIPLLSHADSIEYGVFKDDDKSDIINCPGGEVNVRLEYRSGEGKVSPEFLDAKSKWRVVKSFEEDKISDTSDHYNIDLVAPTVYRLRAFDVERNSRIEYQLKCV